MCSPIYAAAGAQGVSGVLGGQAAYEAAKGDERQLAFERDRELALATDAINRGAAESGRARAAGSAAVSENKVALASGGVDVQSGTALDILEGTRALSELDVATIRNNARREAWGHKTQADQFEFGRQMSKYNRRMGVAGTFLGTAANMGGMIAMSRVGSAKGKA